MVEAAAQVSLHGMDPMAFLRATDPLERLTMQAVANAATDLERRRDRERAELTASEIVRRLAAAIKK